MKNKFSQFGIDLFYHPFGQQFSDPFRRHVIAVIEKAFRAFDDEPVHEILGDELVCGGKESGAGFIVMFFRDQAGKSRRFQSLLEEELMDGFPAFLLRAGPER